MNSTSRYTYETSIGVFSIELRKDGWNPVFKNEPLGSYRSKEQAAEAIAGGHTFSVGAGIDTSKLGIPSDILEWSAVQKK